MAQVVKLKRTSVEGKVPTTATLELGELAINTYDGKIYFEKDSGTPSIEQIVTTNSTTTGSIQLLGSVTASYFIGNIQSTNGVVSGSSQILTSLVNQSIDLGTGSITASYFVGNGSGITNLPAADVSQVATVTSSFDNQSSVSVTHNFNTKNVLISVYGTNDSQIIPSSTTLTNNNTATIELSSAQSGYVVVAKGGHIVSGSISADNISGLETKITDLTSYSQLVSGSSTYSITHDLNEEYPLVQTWNTTTKRQELPQIIESTSVNVISITFSGIFDGKIIVKK